MSPLYESCVLCSISGWMCVCCVPRPIGAVLSNKYEALWNVCVCVCEKYLLLFDACLCVCAVILLLIWLWQSVVRC